MAIDLIKSNYNPDVLSCLANLSNDEVFTPPDVVNQMLDMLPQELFSNPDTTFLDPATKSGVFLREIAKRLMVGLENQIPDVQERVDHIFKKQLFGIAITELTSLLARRSLYCSKYPNSSFSVTKFDAPEGNIRYKQTSHTWVDGKCKYCSVSKKSELGSNERGISLESHAYEWIHDMSVERIYNMKFDVIISNPPYQLNVGVEKENFAIPLYHTFIEKAIRLNPRYLSMIIPARWYSGGRGLDEFREKMLNDTRIRQIVDYPDSKDCFQGVDIAGGVCYFLWDRDHMGDCTFTSCRAGKMNSTQRCLSEFSLFPRYNEALSIIHKVLALGENKMSDTVSVQTPFGFITTYKGQATPFSNSLLLKTSKTDMYVRREDVSKNIDLVDKYKTIFGAATCEHAGTPAKDGKYKVFSSLGVLPPTVVCTQSYFVADTFENELEAQNLVGYLKTKTVRFLVLQALTSQHLARDKFLFVPQQDYTIKWTDDMLYKKYSFTSEEIEFIESMIRDYEQ